MDSVIKTANTSANKLFSSGNTVLIIQIALIIYIAIVAPMSAEYLIPILDNFYSKLAFVGLILFVVMHNVPTALLLSIAFIVSIQTINMYKVVNGREGFRGVADNAANFGSQDITGVLSRRNIMMKTQQGSTVGAAPATISSAPADISSSTSPNAVTGTF